MNISIKISKIMIIQSQNLEELCISLLSLRSAFFIVLVVFEICWSSSSSSWCWSTSSSLITLLSSFILPVITWMSSKWASWFLSSFICSLNISLFRWVAPSCGTTKSPFSSILFSSKSSSMSNLPVVVGFIWFRSAWLSSLSSMRIQELIY